MERSKIQIASAGLPFTVWDVLNYSVIKKCFNSMVLHGVFFIVDD